MKLFELPRVVGSYKGKEIVSGIGRFGPFLKYDSKFISLGKEKDPRTVDLENSIEIIEEHFKKEKEKIIKEFPKEGIQILNGRFGAYIKRGKDIFKIPTGTRPEIS